MFVKTLEASLDGSPTPPLSVRYPPRPQLAAFDALGEAIYLGSEKIESEHWWNRLSTMSYNRPHDAMGAEAVGNLDQWLEHGLDLGGGKDSLGFLFLYELMTASLNMRILPADSPYILGALLVRSLPPSDHRRRGPLMSILRVLSYNPHLASGMPRYEDNRRFKMRRMLKSSDMLKALFDAVREYLVKHQSQVRWPPQRPPYRASAMIKIEAVGELREKLQRRWLDADVTDSANESRNLKAVKFEPPRALPRATPSSSAPPRSRTARARRSRPRGSTSTSSGGPRTCRRVAPARPRPRCPPRRAAC